MDLNPKGPIAQAAGRDMSRSVMDYTPEEHEQRQNITTAQDIVDMLSNLIPAKGAAGFAGAGILKGMRGSQGGLNPASVAGLLQSLNRPKEAKALYGLAQKDIQTAKDPDFLEMLFRESGITSQK
jgi:hypothetical protein